MSSVSRLSSCGTSLTARAPAWTRRGPVAEHQDLALVRDRLGGQHLHRVSCPRRSGPSRPTRALRRRGRAPVDRGDRAEALHDAAQADGEGSGTTSQHDATRTSPLGTASCCSTPARGPGECPCAGSRGPRRTRRPGPTRRGSPVGARRRQARRPRAASDRVDDEVRIGLPRRPGTGLAHVADPGAACLVVGGFEQAGPGLPVPRRAAAPSVASSTTRANAAIGCSRIEPSGAGRLGPASTAAAIVSGARPMRKPPSTRFVGPVRRPAARTCSAARRTAPVRPHRPAAPQPPRRRQQGAPLPARPSTGRAPQRAAPWSGSGTNRKGGPSSSASPPPRSSGALAISRAYASATSAARSTGLGEQAAELRPDAGVARLGESDGDGARCHGGNIVPVRRIPAVAR